MPDDVHHRRKLHDRLLRGERDLPAEEGAGRDVQRRDRLRAGQSQLRECGSGHCDDGVCCNSARSGSACQFCNLPGNVGTCTTATEGSTPRSACANGYLCNGTSPNCPTSCNSDIDCITTEYCNSLGQCVARLKQGDACNPTPNGDCKVAGCRDCLSGNCIDGFCCDTTCSGSCQYCNLPGAHGTCTVAPAQDPGRGGACSPNLCNGASASCPTTCAHDTDCVNGDYCSAAGLCTARKSNGASCNTAAGADCKDAKCRECQSGSCADGVCCDSDCNGSCDYCNLAGKIGTCSPAPAGDPGANPPCSGSVCNGVNTSCGNTCATDNDCGANYFCHKDQTCHPVATQGNTCNTATGGDCRVPGCRECGGNPCVDGVCCNSACGNACDACNVPGSLGTCTIVAAGSSGSPSCAPYKCDGSSSTCPGACTKDTDCAQGDYCAPDGKCTPKGAPGAKCTSGAGCGTGFCVDGVCCDVKCDGQCQACDVQGSVGTCSPVKGPPHGNRTACDGTGACGGTCDGATVDKCTYPPPTTLCGSSCTTALLTPNACDGHGKCVPGQKEACPGNLQCADDKVCKTSC